MALPLHSYQKKRLVVCCDGTWDNSDNGYNKEKHALVIPSNVTRFIRALAQEGESEIPQIAYYQAGVGTGNNILDKFGGGATGEGVNEHIREAYAFLALNWRQDTGGDPANDDELFLLGFSRGAFTARSIVGFISTVGLLTRRGMEYFYEIFKDYENMNVEDYENPLSHHSDIQGKPRLTGDNASKRKYFEYLRNLPEPLTSKRIPTVKALGVWDTVGSLGFPGVKLVDDIKEHLHEPVYRKELQFYDTNLSEHVEYAFQALALDETRYSFTPAVWEKAQGVTTKLKQVWFPGVHSNIGGGMSDFELSDITLAWMISQFDQFLRFDAKYIISMFKLNQQQSTAKPWGCGNINTKDNSPIYKVAGEQVRTPGQYCKVNNQTGEQREDHKPLENTRERIHSSVRVRLASSMSKGINDEGKYLAEALTAEKKNAVLNRFLGPRHVLRHGWKLRKTDKTNPLDWKNDFSDMERDIPLFYWACADSGEGFQHVMVEDTLGLWEKKLLEIQGLEKGFEDFLPNEQWMSPPT